MIGMTVGTLIGKTPEGSPRFGTKLPTTATGRAPDSDELEVELEQVLLMQVELEEDVELEDVVLDEEEFDEDSLEEEALGMFCTHRSLPTCCRSQLSPI